MTVPRAPRGFSPGTVESRTVWCSISESCAPNKITIEEHPDHHADAPVQRTICCVIVGEIREVPWKQRGTEPRDSGKNARNADPLPARFAPAGPVAVKRGETEYDHDD
jgi:hypothetical protein